MNANTLLSLLGYFSLLLSLIACDKPKPAVPSTVCYLTRATEQVTQDIPPTLTLDRSFTYTNGQLANLSERSDAQQASYRIDYQDGQVVQATGSPVTMLIEHDAKTGTISRATMTKGAQTQSVFTLTHTASGRLNTLTETRQVLATGSLVVSRTYSFSYTNAGNVSVEHAQFTFQNGSTLDQETNYTVGTEGSTFATFPERSLLTVLSVGQQFETRPGRLWNNNVLTGYQTYTFNGANRLLAESATFANQFDTNSNLTSSTQTTKYYIPAGSTSASTKPTSHTFAYECR